MIIGTFINLNPWGCECAICGDYGGHSHAIPWDGGPTKEGLNDGGYMTVCAGCFGKWKIEYGGY